MRDALVACLGVRTDCFGAPHALMRGLLPNPKLFGCEPAAVITLKTAALCHHGIPILVKAEV